MNNNITNITKTVSNEKYKIHTSETNEATVSQNKKIEKQNTLRFEDLKNLLYVMAGANILLEEKSISKGKLDLTA